MWFCPADVFYQYNEDKTRPSSVAPQTWRRASTAKHLVLIPHLAKGLLSPQIGFKISVLRQIYPVTICRIIVRALIPPLTPGTHTYAHTYMLCTSPSWLNAFETVMIGGLGSFAFFVFFFLAYFTSVKTHSPTNKHIVFAQSVKKTNWKTTKKQTNHKKTEMTKYSLRTWIWLDHNLLSGGSIL